MDSVFSVTETGQPWQEGLLRPQAAHREEFSQEAAELAPGSPWCLEVTASFTRVIHHEGHVSHLLLCNQPVGNCSWRVEIGTRQGNLSILPPTVQATACGLTCGWPWMRLASERRLWQHGVSCLGGMTLSRCGSQALALLFHSQRERPGLQASSNTQGPMLPAATGVGYLVFLCCLGL